MPGFAGRLGFCDVVFSILGYYTGQRIGEPLPVVIFRERFFYAPRVDSGRVLGDWAGRKRCRVSLRSLAR